MNAVNRQELAPGVYFSSVDDGRFKTGRISVTMLVPLKKETAARNALLPQVLTHSCKKYPDFISLNKRLNSLYGASVMGYCRKFGESQALTLSIAGLDDRFTIDKEQVSAELTGLLCAMLFEPKLEDGTFCKQDVEQERRQLLDAIDAEYNEKRVYAVNRCTEIMCINEAFGIRRYGSREAVEKLSERDVYSAWEDVLKTARVEVMMIGASDKTAAADTFRKAFEKVSRRPAEIKTEVVRSAGDITREAEALDVAQSKLVMAFRTGIAEPDDGVMAQRLMSAVLGGTPNSKFFVNVREKYSLCYYCAARYDRNKGILMVDSGVETQNIEKAEKEILNQIHALQNGDLSDFEMDSTKLSMTNSFNSMSDTVGGTEAWYISQLLDKEQLTPEEASKRVMSVSAQQVIDAARKLTLDTVYILKPSGAGEEKEGAK